MVFALFIKVIIPGLQDPTHPYYIEHKTVLASLSDVKSILLLNDVGDDDLLLKLFSTCFDTVSGSSNSTTEEQIPKDVIYHLSEVLTTLIDEGPNMTGHVMEVIMAQFLRAAPPGGSHVKTEQNGNQSTLLLKEEPEAYVMAKGICNSCPEKMARYVSQYFSDVIMDASGFATKSNGQKNEDDSDDEDQPSGPSESDLKELKKAHLLIRELWRASPLVLQNVVPQVEAELSADNVHLRQIATETLGDMISGIGAAGPPPPPIHDPAMYPPVLLTDEPPSAPTSSVLTTPLSVQSFAQTHSAAYHNFVGRRNDKVAAIRAAWTTAAGYILSTSAGGIGLSREEESELVKALAERLNDNDDKVRLAAVKAVELFSFRDIITKLGPNGGVNKEGSVLGSLGDRVRDRRHVIRVEAMVLLGKLWAVAAGELAAGQEAVIASLSGIPSRILNTFYTNDPELNILLDRVLFECLVPLAFPPPPKGKGAKNSQSGTGTAFDQDKIRAERILLLVKALDSQAKKAFFAMQGRQPQFAKILSAFIRQCESYNGGVMDDDEDKKTANLDKTIKYIVQFFPDDGKVKSDLFKFARTNDRRNYQLIKFAVGSESDYKTIHRAIKELVKRIQSGSSSVTSTLDTLIPMIYRSASIMFNRSHLSTFMDYSKSDKDGLGAVSHEILNEISQRNPDLFKTHVVELCKDLVERAPSDEKENDPAVVDTLKACSSYSKKYPSEIPQDKRFNQTLVAYALYGRPVKVAKFAVNILMAKKDDKSMVTATNLLQKIMKDWSYDAPHFLNNLATVSQLELLAPKVTFDHDDDILDMTVQKLLLQVRADASEKDPSWVDDTEMDNELHAKLLALKIHVNRLRSTEDVEEAKERAKPVFKLLRTLVTKSGELCKVKDTPKHHKSRLRLRAAQLMLKLCTIKHLDDMLTPAAFNELAYVTQDPEPGVRRGFVEKLQKYLVQNRLKSRFYTIIFLTAFEPMAEFKQHVETWIRSRARAFEGRDQHVMEALMGRLISLLAHHPDYSPELDELVDHARYILYYVSNVATESNLGLIFKYAERVKQTLDGINETESDNLYVLSDLAQAVIRKWQEKKNWSFQAYPQKVGLPMGLYAHLPSHDVAQKIAQKQYIPDGIDERLDDLLKAADKKKVWSLHYPLPYSAILTDRRSGSPWTSERSITRPPRRSKQRRSPKRRQ
jgi:sister chromatid cohesion protein PDS5